MKKMRHLLMLPILILAFNSWAYGQWAQIKSYPSAATDGMFSFTIGDKAYVGGGLDEKHMYRYDAAANTWTKVKDVPSPGDHLAWAFAFSANGKGYVGGGSYGNASELSDELWEYDPAMDTWSQKADFMGGPKDGAFAFVAGGKAYIGGGFDGANMDNAVFRYDPAMDSWNILPVYPGGPIIFGQAFVIGDKAYVSTGGQGNDEITETWMFDPSVGTWGEWTQKAAFPGDARQAAVSFAINGKGYVGGGMSGYTVMRKDFWEYNPATDQWKNVGADFPTESIAWSTAFAIGNTAYVGSGTSLPDFNFTNAFYKYTFKGSAIEDLNQDIAFSLYPVPARDVLYINAPENEKIQRVTIIDNCGKEVLKQAVQGGSDITVPVESLSKGIYTLRIQTVSSIGNKIFMKN